MQKLLTLLFVVISFTSSHLAQASELLVEKKRFELSNFETFGGKTIKQVQVGWESYGELNADKSNVVLITHYFSANSHAAGKYHPDDEQPGYWDAIIGPGKAIDTNTYFVISVDTLANLGVHNPNVITTGPASINPDTGKPYGLDFPVVTIRDFVNVQKALLESLGIKKLHAVIGPSMGSLQALEWASAYPDWVERMVSVIGAGYMDAWTVSALEHWATPIKLDPNFNDGNYYSDEPPTQGLTAALALVTQNALHPAFFNQVLKDHHPIETAPLEDIRNTHQIVDWVNGRAAQRAKTADANHLLYLVRASQLYLAGQGKQLQDGLQNIKAQTLFLPAAQDLILMPYLVRDIHKRLQSLGKDSQYHELDGQLGHFNGVSEIKQASTILSDFLASE
ncbi:homoserine O-acetyltransferase [Lacimicrobium sp. SS2-24]|uniref:E22 family MetX-like putative esterase n=1 Tax=Lacimicrobium sp. SS2-24 TaxID=2005569 RepID=UPI000B4BFC63|nr:homoserine O-acetyltransferase [Lacimicrobium sp. SS2-24]